MGNPPLKQFLENFLDGSYFSVINILIQKFGF